MPDGTARIIKIEKHESKNDTGSIEVEAHRVVGLASDWNSGSRTNTGILHYNYRKLSRSASETDSAYPARDGEAANALLATESYSPLKTLYAQHMFSVFVWAAVKTMEAIPSPAEIRFTETA